MLGRKVILLFIVACFVSGCGISANSYAANREMLKGSSAIRSEFVQDCISRISQKSISTRQAIAKVMSVTTRRAPNVYCQRITRGIISGRLKHADLNAGARGQLTPTVVRVLQGR